MIELAVAFVVALGAVIFAASIDPKKGPKLPVSKEPPIGRPSSGGTP